MTDENEIMCDVVVVGAGVSGLSAAIRLKQLKPELEVVVLEKGAEVGAHILSGACIETRALDELFPDWRERGAPLHTEAKEDNFLFLTKKRHFRLPTPPQMRNHGNYLISLGNFCRWLAKEAEALGVQIYPGFPAAKAMIENGCVVGVLSGAFGIGKNGEEKANYQPPMAIRARYTIFAEGCRGSLSEQLMKSFALRENCDPQTYAIGLKELWDITPEKHQQGKVIHTIGWPLDAKTCGGSFVYHMENNQLSLGLVVGLDYENPHLSPYEEFQRFKTHPTIAALLAGGRRVSYGARALNEGGFQSIPKLSFPGGVLVGCAAGFLNMPKIKGTHTAMKSAMLAADAIKVAHSEGRSHDTVEEYEKALRASWVADELYEARNIRPGFQGGLWRGLLGAALETFVFKGKSSRTLHHHADHTRLKKAAASKKIAYPKPDGVLSFDRLSSVFLSNTNHEEDQPCHLRLKQAAVPIAVNLAEYDAPEQRYCPAGVYEIVTEEAKPRLQINAQNCVHCKTCDIKDPTQNIVWVTPEGGGGPNYPNM